MQAGKRSGASVRSLCIVLFCTGDHRAVLLLCQWSGVWFCVGMVAFADPQTHVSRASDAAARLVRE